MAAVPLWTRPRRRDSRTHLGAQSDDNVLDRLAAGDEAALALLLGSFWRPLTGYATRLLADGDAADDVVQDAFVRVWTRRGRWKKGSSLPALLFTLTRNAALDELRRRRSRSHITRLQLWPAQPPPRTPSDILEREEIGASVEQAIQNLPLRRREVFDLVYLRGLTYDEAGRVLGISPKTVGNQLSAALRQLRRMLEPLVLQTGVPSR